MAHSPAVHEPAIGVLCLETFFTKIPGHIRNPVTFGFPVRYRVVAGATPERVVSQGDRTLLGPFLDAARELEAQGAAAITSACGFLALFQRELADAVGIPLYASSLIQVPMVHRMLRTGQRVGLLTASKDALTRRHLAAVGAESVPVCVAGMAERLEFREVVLEGKRDELDAGRLGREVLAEAGGLIREHPETGAIVIECTDLAPFAAEIGELTGLPVFDIVTLTRMVRESIARPAPPGRSRDWPAGRLPAGDADHRCYAGTCWGGAVDAERKRSCLLTRLAPFMRLVTAASPRSRPGSARPVTSMNCCRSCGPARCGATRLGRWR